MSYIYIAVTFDALPIVHHPSVSGGGGSGSNQEDLTVMSTKLKIIEILEYIMNVRLDYRMSSLLTIFKKDFNENGASDTLDGDGGGDVSYPIIMFMKC